MPADTSPSETEAALRPRAGTALSFDDVSVSYTTNGQVATAVSGLSFDVHHGEFVTLVGPSGCGKSTLLKALIGINPHKGTILVNGKPSTSARSSDVAMVFQEPRLLPWRNVLRNVSFALECQGVGRNEARKVARDELQRVGLANAVDKYPGQLSGGMQQRANLARALALDPEVLLLDEPLAALDAQTREYMQQELLGIWESKRKTALFVTHQVDEAIYLADRVVVLTRGPGSVKQIFDVPFSRPRPLSIKRSSEFMRLEDAIWASIDKAADTHSDAVYA
jgi:NitT/TauT family transport system ATP-binding protein